MDKLTSRQREVLQLLAEGLPVKEIAFKLNGSSRTGSSREPDVPYIPSTETPMKAMLRLAGVKRADALSSREALKQIWLAVARLALLLRKENRHRVDFPMTLFGRHWRYLD